MLWFFARNPKIAGIPKTAFRCGRTRRNSLTHRMSSAISFHRQISEAQTALRWRGHLSSLVNHPQPLSQGWEQTPGKYSDGPRRDRCRHRTCSRDLHLEERSRGGTTGQETPSPLPFLLNLSFIRNQGVAPSNLLNQINGLWP